MIDIVDICILIALSLYMASICSLIESAMPEEPTTLELIALCSRGSASFLLIVATYLLWLIVRGKL